MLLRNQKFIIDLKKYKASISFNATHYFYSWNMEISRWIDSLSCVWPERGADNTKAAEIHELPLGHVLFNGVSY